MYKYEQSHLTSSVQCWYICEEYNYVKTHEGGENI